jgi:calcineurin-like phosphoesterase family protein
MQYSGDVVMPAVFLISDTHFGHEKTCTVFKREDGSPLRPFSSADEMDEFMVKAWNERVRPKDKVYHLGDVAIARKSLGVLRRLNGDKVLIRGNHDIYKLNDYTEHFRDIRSYHVMNGLILSHVPVHEASLGRFGCNIHGHLHANRVMKARGVDARTGGILHSDEIDPRYHCVCVEATDFAPILFEDVVKRIEAEGGTVGFRNGNGPTM